MRRVVAIFILIFTAGALLAADDSPRFFIERIDVRNTRHASPAIIRAETRLVPGQTYSEADLREASYRVARLPFVLDAQYSLEKGSRRDAYVFVITISETKPFFYDAELNGVFGGGYNGLHGAAQTALALGGRMFVGSRGVFYGGVGSSQITTSNETNDIRTIQAGYTQYDLFGTRAFATIDVNSHIGNGSYIRSTPNLSLLLGVPITANQTFTLSTGAAYSGGRSRSITGERRTYDSNFRVHSVSWSYNTTNSPFFPTRGVIITAAGSRNTTVTTGVGPQHDDRADSANNTFVLSGAKYWELSERNSVSAVLRTEMDRTRSNGFAFLLLTDEFVPYSSRYRSNNQFLTVELSHNLLDSKRTRAVGDSRVGVTASIGHFGTNRVTEGLPYANDYRSSSVEGSVGAWWARRTAWGMLRIGANYGW